MKKYKFWSIAKKNRYKDCADYEWIWLCIPPDKKYIPKWYPKGALVKKHEEEVLPPPSYWLDAEYENIVYSSD